MDLHEQWQNLTRETSIVNLKILLEYADEGVLTGSKIYEKHAKALTRIIKALENGDFE